MASYDWSMGGPLTKETDSTYGGTKPGKAPTPKPPNSPDPFSLIEAQANANRYNEVGPSGSTIWSKGQDGRYTQTRNFSPELGKMFNRQVGLLEDPNMSDAGVERAVFDRQKALLDPVFEQQDRSLEQKLANQGLPMGSEAYAGERTRFDRSRNEALTGAAQEAVLTGRQEGRASRTSEFNQLAALLGGQQTNPGTPIDVMGPFGMQQQGNMAGYQGALTNSQNQNQQRTQGATALASLMGMMMMCWVAEELYGIANPKTLRIRAYLNYASGKPLFVRLFTKLYQRFGRAWAKFVKRNRFARFFAKKVFDRLDVYAGRYLWQ